MKQFTFSEINRASGEILKTALVEPVALTKRGKEKLVILSAPDEVHQELMTGLDAIIAGDDDNA